MRQLEQTFAAFAVRDFRFMWGGSLLSVTAFMTSFMLVPSVAYEITGSYAASGIAAMGSGVSQMLLGPFGGVIADRYPKKPLVLAGQVTPGILIGAMGFLILTDRITIALLFGATLLMGVGFSLMGPARQAWTGEIVPRRLLANAVALQQMAMNVGQVVGPLMVLVALAAFDLTGAKSGYLFLLVASFFVIVLPMTSAIRSGTTAPPKSERRPPLLEMREGLRYMLRNPRLRILWPFFMVVIMCGFAFQTLLPGILAQEFGRDPFDVAPILAPFGVASLLINIPLAGLVGGRWAWHSLLVTAVMMAIGLWLVAGAPSFLALLISGAVMGAGRSGVMLVNQSIMMANTRPQFFGRVMSLVMMGFGVQSLLTPIWGVVADVFGGRETMALLGVITIVAVGLMTIAWLRTRDLPLDAGTAAASMGRRVAGSVQRPVPANGLPANGAQPVFADRLAPVVLMDPQKAEA